MERTAGLGFKLGHLDLALACCATGLWFEVHAENYMVDGGPRLAALQALRIRHPVSLHGVGLSLASTEPPDPQHLRGLATLVQRIEPAAVSDHLAWSRWSGGYHADFLPFPRSAQALAVVAGNIGRAQDAIGRRLLIENPSAYVDLSGHEMDEETFLAELTRRTGCGLLLDINNLHVSAHNLGQDADARLDAFPADAVGEVHLAGHTADAGGELLIDSHDAPVAKAVWDLYRRFIARAGPVATLIERDDHVPPFEVLMSERERAHDILLAAKAREPAHA